MFFEVEYLFPESCILRLQSFDLIFVPVSQIFVFGKLVFEFVVLVVVSCLELTNFVLEEQNLGRVVLLESFNLKSLLGCVLFLCVLKFSFHIVVGSRHEILELVFLFLELDLACLFGVDEVVAPDCQHIQLFDFVLKHILQFLNMSFVQLVTLQSLFFEELDLQFETAVHFR